MKNANPVFDKEDVESTNPAERIQKYIEKFGGNKTDVRKIPYPKPDRQWFSTLTHFLQVVDAETIQFGHPTEYTDVDSDVVTLHESNGHQVLSVVGDEIMTLTTTEFGDNLDISTTDSGISIKYDDGTEKVVSVENETGISLSIDIGGNETKLRVVNTEDSARLEFVAANGNVIELTDTNKQAIGNEYSIGDPVYKPPKIPALSLTGREAQADSELRIPPNVLIYAVPEREGYINLADATEETYFDV
jgi:hypothetical protein